MPERMRRFIIGPYACGLESHRTYQPPRLSAVKKSMIRADLLKCVIFKQHLVDSSAAGKKPSFKGANTHPEALTKFSLKLYPLTPRADGCGRPPGNHCGNH